MDPNAIFNMIQSVCNFGDQVDEFVCSIDVKFFILRIMMFFFMVVINIFFVVVFWCVKGIFADVVVGAGGRFRICRGIGDRR